MPNDMAAMGNFILRLASVFVELVVESVLAGLNARSNSGVYLEAGLPFGTS